MNTPEQALEAARRAAAHDVDADGVPWRLPDPSTSARRLVEWAIIEPERAQIYSTRRYGKPITFLKRLLVRFLSQYLNEVAAQQSRFNAAVAAQVMRLEERVATLERERERPPSA
jgi:hypothetical protein